MTDKHFKSICAKGVIIDSALSEVPYEDEVTALLIASIMKWCDQDKYKAYGMVKEMYNLMEEVLKDEDR